VNRNFNQDLDASEGQRSPKARINTTCRSLSALPESIKMSNAMEDTPRGVNLVKGYQPLKPSLTCSFNLDYADGR